MSDAYQSEINYATGESPQAEADTGYGDTNPDDDPHEGVVIDNERQTLSYTGSDGKRHHVALSMINGDIEGFIESHPTGDDAIKAAAGSGASAPTDTSGVYGSD